MMRSSAAVLVKIKAHGRSTAAFLRVAPPVLSIKGSTVYSASRISNMDLKFIDIGVNLVDPMYQGEYQGCKKHDPDMETVLNRAWKHGLDKMVITGGSLSQSKSAIQLSRADDRLFATVGCHPTRCNEFESGSTIPDRYLSDLLQLIRSNGDKVVALGEFGLDYDRLNFCPKDLQKKYFEMQLSLAEETGLPLFLHCRNASIDMVEILERNKHRVKSGGVVHSFDGTVEEATEFIDLGYHVGINGCSLKTEENLSTVKQLPIDRLLLETDAPWCEIRPSHAGHKHVLTKFDEYPSVKRDKWQKCAMVKSRNEPCRIRQVLEVICAVKGQQDLLSVASTVYETTTNLFFSNR